MLAGERHGPREAVGHVGAAQQPAHGAGVGTRHAHDVGHRRHALGTQRIGRGLESIRAVEHHEAAAPRIGAADERQPLGGLLVPIDHDVLQQLAEAGFHRPLVGRVHIQTVGHGAALADAPVGLAQHHAGGVAEFRAARRQLLERRQPRLERRRLLLARAHVADPGVERGPQRGHFQLPLDAAHGHPRNRVAGAVQIGLDAGALGFGRRRLAHHLAALDIQLAQELGHSLGLRGGVLHRVLDRGDGVGAAVDLRAHRLDVGFQPLDGGMRLRMFGAGGGELRGGRVAGRFRLGGGQPAGLEGEPRGLAARLQLLDLLADRRAARLQRLRLLPVEVELLLPDRHLQLARVGVLAQAGGPLFRRGQVQPHAGQIVLALGHAGRRGRFAFARGVAAARALRPIAADSSR